MSCNLSERAAENKCRKPKKIKTNADLLILPLLGPGRTQARNLGFFLGLFLIFLAYHPPESLASRSFNILSNVLNLIIDLNCLHLS